MYEIEKNVSMPKKGLKASDRFPLSMMEIGDSFFVPLAECSVNIRAVVTSSAFRLKMKIRSRKTPEGIHFWRVA